MLVMAINTDLKNYISLVVKMNGMQHLNPRFYIKNLHFIINNDLKSYTGFIKDLICQQLCGSC